jgi:hypothetical protein
MADATTDSGILPRTYFRAPRVPFDFRAVAIAILACLVFLGGTWLLEKIADPNRPVAAFFAWVAGLLPWSLLEWLGLGEFMWRGGATEPNFWHRLIGGAWVFVVWAYFGQAIHRIASMRIARDEGLSLKEAFAFSSANFLTVLRCPLIVAVFIAVLWGCNALAGLLISIPYGGQLLSVVLVPLAFISSLLILLIAIGGIAGMPLISAAAAWERNGSLDAISRAFSYVFARPLQFLWNYGLIFLFVGVILFVGAHFAGILERSVGHGLWQDTPDLYVNTPVKGDARYEKYDADTKAQYDKAEEKAKGERPFAGEFDAAVRAPAAHWLTVVVFFLVINLIKYGVAGYALYWFLGATTSTYADLRADVDGTEEDEIYVEEEDEDIEALNRPEVPTGPAAAPPEGPGPTGPPVGGT